VVARGRAGGPPARGAAANRAGRGGAAGGRGAARQTARGVGRAKGSLPGKLIQFQRLQKRKQFRRSSSVSFQFQFC
jgi:hypothetical protein